MYRLGLILLILNTLFQISAQQNIEIPENLQLLWEQVANQPDDFAIACLPTQSPADTVLYNGDNFPLASVSKLLIFIEYARRVDVGAIPLDEIVPLDTLNRYNLPRTDRGAHDRFLEQYPDGIDTLPLWEVATEGMMQFSSNAASDYLLDRLAPVDWDALYLELGLFRTDAPHSLTMIPLLMNNHSTGLVELDEVPDLSVEQGEAYLNQYINDEIWRADEIEHRTASRRFPDWGIQSAILQEHTATSNIGDFLSLMRIIYGNSPVLSDNVKFMIRTALQWRNSDFINANYAEYGSKLGFYSGGTLTLIAYGEPYNAQPVISIIFFRNIPRAMYSSLVRDDSIGDLAHWLNINACAGLRETIDATTQ